MVRAKTANKNMKRRNSSRQNYRKEQEDKEGLARELKSTLMSVPVSESHPLSTIFSFCCPYNTESHTL